MGEVVFQAVGFAARLEQQEKIPRPEVRGRSWSGAEEKMRAAKVSGGCLVWAALASQIAAQVDLAFTWGFLNGESSLHRKLQLKGKPCLSPGAVASLLPGLAPG